MGKIVREIAELVVKGWRPYRGEVQPQVYEKLKCTHGQLTAREDRTRPYWFSRGDIFLCIGCHRKCSLSRPVGFMAPLPIEYEHDPAHPFRLPPQEMVARRHTLLVAEAAYCLNVSRSLIYRYIRDGRLIVLKETPVRVRASDVATLMNDFDE